MDAQEDLEWEREHGEDAVFARPPFWLYLSIKSDRATLHVLGTSCICSLKLRICSRASRICSSTLRNSVPYMEYVL